MLVQIKMKKIIRSYNELIQIPTFEERLEYLMIKGKVGEETFGFDRWINQMFYHSNDWKLFRRDMIVRDLGHDLAMLDDSYEIVGTIIMHHMNPIDVNDIVDLSDYVMNPNFVVATSLNTHNAIHYGIEVLKPLIPVERRPGDTCPWKNF